MKKLILLFLIIPVIIISCSQEQPKFQIGAWKLVQTQRVTNGKVVVTFPTDLNKEVNSQLKMYSEKNWMFVGKSLRDTVVADVYGGGTYTLEGTKYEETIMYHYGKQWVGRTSKNMTMEFVSDTLVQSYHPISAVDGQAVDSITNIQKYVRLR
ncbi:MAG: hypothetical protein MZV63_36295 [Marinilabiliales bacterium]|nr:hypothetical protein [Marinilabiliales bacterium]